MGGRDDKPMEHVVKFILHDLAENFGGGVRFPALVRGVVALDEFQHGKELLGDLKADGLGIPRVELGVHGADDFWCSTIAGVLRKACVSSSAVMNFYYLPPNGGPFASD